MIKIIRGKFRSICLILTLVLALVDSNAQDQKIILVDNKITPVQNLLDMFTIEKVIKLETNEDNLINYIFYLEITENQVYVSNYYGCFVFNHQGEFLDKVFDLGKGPGEIAKPSGLSINPNNGDIAFYDNLGRALSIYSDIGVRKNKISPNLLYIGDLYWMTNGSFLLQSYLPQDLLSKKKLPIFCIYEFDPITRNVRGVLDLPNNYHSMSIKYHTTFSEFNGDYYVILPLDNNVYKYSASSPMKIKYTFDFGKENVPDKLTKGGLVKEQILMKELQMGKFYSLVDFQELPDHYLIIYDKWPNRYTHLISKRDDTQQRHSFRNSTDILGATTPFFEHNGLMIASLRPSTFLDRYSNADLDRLSELERQIYSKIAEGLEITDNPVLLFLKPK